MVLASYTDQEIQAEMKRRKNKKAEAMAKYPEPLASNPEGLQNLIKTCESYHDFRRKRGYFDDDDARYIYEAAVEFVYGPDYFIWRNQMDA